MEEYLRELGYALMIVNSNDHAADDSMLIDLLVQEGFRVGITVASCRIPIGNSRDETIRKKLTSFPSPM